MKIDSKVWSNAFFLIPLFIALWNQMLIHSIILIIVTTMSTTYYLLNTKIFGIADKFFAYTLVIYNLYICYLSGFKIPYFAIAFIFATIACYFFFIKRKDDYEWHISSAFVTLFCILALLNA